MTASKSPLVPPHAELSIAEAFVLLSVEWPVKADALIAWSDSDFALAGALLMDLAFLGKVDSDLDDLIMLEREPALHQEQPLALRILGRFSRSVRLDIALNELVTRIGDLRLATLAALAGREIRLTSSSPLSWDFHQASFRGLRVRATVSLRQTLKKLVESEELPLPEQAALISLLCACDIAGPVLGGRACKTWLARNAARLEAIRRMDLVGRAVADAVAVMRRRLRTYLLDADTEKAAPSLKSKRKSPSVNYSRSKTTWEWRAFWPDGEVVELPAAWGNIGQDSDCEEELLEDSYLFVRGKKDNVKIRAKGLKIKPVVEAFDDFIAFAPSAKFRFPRDMAPLARLFPRLYEVRGELRSTDELIEIMYATGYQPSVLKVSKARRVHGMTFGVQIEFARIEVDGRVFHSISMESPYLTALRILARNIPVGEGQVAGYSEFLDGIVRKQLA